MRVIPGDRMWSILAMLPWLAGSALANDQPSKLGLCAACHGETGRATLSGTPHLAGQDEDYLVAQLLAFREGRRDNAPMRAAIGSVSDAQLRELARWYAAQDPCHVGTE